MVSSSSLLSAGDVGHWKRKVLKCLWETRLGKRTMGNLNVTPSLWGSSGPLGRNDSNKLHRLRIPIGRRQTSWLCISGQVPNTRDLAATNLAEIAPSFNERLLHCTSRASKIISSLMRQKSRVQTEREEFDSSDLLIIVNNKNKYYLN